MRRSIFLVFLLVVILTVIGCGGSSPSTVGTIRGTVTIGATSTESITVSTSSIAKSNFAKVSLRQTQISHQHQSVSNERIIKLQPGVSPEEAAKIIASLGGKLKKKIYGTDGMYVMTVNDQTFSDSSTLKNANVEYVEKNLKVHAFAIPNDTYYTSPYYWNYNMMNMAQAWDVQKGESAGIVVAVVDTGVAPNHPDLKSNLVSGYDFVDNDSSPWDTTLFG